MITTMISRHEYNRCPAILGTSRAAFQHHSFCLAGCSSFHKGAVFCKGCKEQTSQTIGDFVRHGSWPWTLVDSRWTKCISQALFKEYDSMRNASPKLSLMAWLNSVSDRDRDYAGQVSLLIGYQYDIVNLSA